MVDRRKLLLLLLFLRRHKRKRQRKLRSSWVRQIFQCRSTMGEYHALVQEMRLFDNDSFYKYFHMSPVTFNNLLIKLIPVISRKTTPMRSPVPPGERLAVTLRYLVTGDSFQTISFSFRLGHSTVCGIIEDTCQAIWDVLSPEFLNPPQSREEWKRISEGFERTWQFPHCIGAIDGKHIQMQAPANSGSQYFNYKGTHSIVLMAVCDYNYCFTLLDIGDYGRQSDGGVFSNSSFGRALESNLLSIPEPDVITGQTSPTPYFLVGDSAFPLKGYMLRPYPGTYLPENKRVFNYRLSRARRVIENTFGILASKFRVFRRPIIAKPEKVNKIVQAACVLHNYLKITEIHCRASERIYCPSGYIDREDSQGNIIPGDWRTHSYELHSVSQVGSNMYSRSAAEMREAVMAYFNSPAGCVPWQQQHINSV